MSRRRRILAGTVIAIVALGLGAPTNAAGPTTPFVPVRPFVAPPEIDDGPLTSPDVGDHCAAGSGADELAAFFAAPIGPVGGADYQRALRLPDDRVLWTLQDAFAHGRLVHNIGLIQSGRCFTVLGGRDGAAWLLDDLTTPHRRWQWILDGVVDVTGGRIHLFVVQMDEMGGHYLARPEPTALRRVVLDAANLAPVDVVDEAPTGEDLYGWSITSDESYTYLYSHCYRQFGHDTLLGFAPCSSDVKLARVPLGRPGAPRTYWGGSGWSNDASAAIAVVDGSFVGSGNNPAQIRYDRGRFLLVEKRDDWWGTTVEFGVAASPFGPFRHVATVDEPLGCERSVCNTYFATWVPWHDDHGRAIWSISRNRWNGSETARHLPDYRPTVRAIDLQPATRTLDAALRTNGDAPVRMVTS